MVSPPKISEALACMGSILIGRRRGWPGLLQKKKKKKKLSVGGVRKKTGIGNFQEETPESATEGRSGGRVRLDEGRGG